MFREIGREHPSWCSKPILQETGGTVVKKIIRISDYFNPQNKQYKNIVELRKNGESIFSIYDKTNIPKEIVEAVCDLVFPMSEFRKCSVCKKIKNIDEFIKNKRGKPLSYCKDCKSGVEEEEPKRRKLHMGYDPKETRDRISHLKRDYGMTIDDYRNMLIEQEYKCAICGCLQSNCDRLFHVDHDHLTGKVRGLLCNRCNGGLGYFKDNIVFLVNAIKYLISNHSLKQETND
jgi:hypothetical protein